jgi:hypothetical protein
MKKLLLLIQEDSQIRDVCLRWAERHLGAIVEHYGFLPGCSDLRIHQAVTKHKPDVAVFSGSLGVGQPLLNSLKWVRTQCRSVFICWDAACPDWWSHLKAYREQQVFDLTTAVDGTPGVDVDFVFPSPNDPDRWVGPSEAKNIELGFGGGISDDHPRARLFRQLADFVTVRDKGNPPGPDAEYVRFVKRCWATLNSAWIGDPRRAMARHVKGRCIEAALGGSALFEAKGSPLAHWFEPNVDYFEFDEERPRDILDVVQSRGYHDICTLYAKRMLQKVRDKYPPQKFWATVMGE